MIVPPIKTPWDTQNFQGKHYSVIPYTNNKTFEETPEYLELHKEQNEIQTEIERLNGILENYLNSNEKMELEIKEQIKNQDIQFEAKIDKSSKLLGMLNFNKQKIELLTAEIENYQREYDSLTIQIALKQHDFDKKYILDCQKDCNDALDKAKEYCDAMVREFVQYYSYYVTTITHLNKLNKQIVPDAYIKDIDYHLLDKVKEFIDVVNDYKHLEVSFYRQNPRMKDDNQFDLQGKFLIPINTKPNEN